MLVKQADPPDPARIPREDVIGVTVVLLTCAYRRQEFIRVGYYVNNEYMDQELKENPPTEPDFDKVQAISVSILPVWMMLLGIGRREVMLPRAYSGGDAL